MRIVKRALAVLALALTLSLVGAISAQAAGVPDLTGNWYPEKSIASQFGALSISDQSSLGVRFQLSIPGQKSISGEAYFPPGETTFREEAVKAVYKGNYNRNITLSFIKSAGFRSVKITSGYTWGTWRLGQKEARPKVTCRPWLMGTWVPCSEADKDFAVSIILDYQYENSFTYCIVQKAAADGTPLQVIRGKATISDDDARYAYLGKANPELVGSLNAFGVVAGTQNEGDAGHLHFCFVNDPNSYKQMRMVSEGAPFASFRRVEK